MGGFPSGYEPKAAADFQGYFSGEYTFDQMVDQLKADFVELKKINLRSDRKTGIHRSWMNA